MRKIKVNIKKTGKKEYSIFVQGFIHSRSFTKKGAVDIKRRIIRLNKERGIIAQY